jgi:hypothetical protein
VYRSAASIATFLAHQTVPLSPGGQGRVWCGAMEEWMERPMGEARGAPPWSLILCACAAVGAGCKSNGSDSAGPAETGECNVEVTDTLPTTGSADACYDSAIEFEIAQGDPDAVISLVDGSGADVPGTTTATTDGKLVTFVPDAPLAPSSPYTATLTYCLGTETVAFTTSAYGEPLADAKALVDKVYVVDLHNPDAARFSKPAGVSAILQTQLTRKIALQAIAPMSSTVATMRLAVLQENGTEQDLCVPTVDFENGTLDGPTFHIGPKDITLIIAGDSVDIGNLEATGAFALDGSSFGCAGFTGLVDTRPLVPLLGQDDSPDDFICTLVAGYGASCVPCRDGESLCLDLEVDHAKGTLDKKIAIVPVTENEVKTNPDCEKKK